MNEHNKELLKEIEGHQKESEKLKVEMESVKREARTDSLTSIANRKAFFDYINCMEESGKLAEGQHCIFLLDIDKFKEVNDTYGHIFGDQVIKSVAVVLSKNTKGKDFPARLGGDEFAVFLPDTSLEGAVAVAESIRSALSKAKIVKSKTNEVVKNIHISVGVANYIQGEEIESSLSRADELLYKAKQNGRNKVEF